MCALIPAEKRELLFNQFPLKYWKSFVGLFITSGLMFFLILKSKPLEILESLSKINYSTTIAAFLCMIFLFVIKTIRWLIILKVLGIRISFIEALILVLVGTFGSSITPAKIGDVLRAYYLSKGKEGVRIGEGVFSVLMDRLLDLIGIFVLLIVSIPFVFLEMDFKEMSWMIIFGLVFGSILFFLLIVFIFNKKITQPLLKALIKFLSKVFRRKHLQKKILVTSDEIIDSFFLHQKKFHFGHYIFLGILSISFWIILGVQGKLLIQTLSSVNVDIIVLITTLCIAAVIAIAIPIGISGIGVRDFVVVYFLTFLLGIIENFQPAILSMSLIQTTLNMLLPGLIGGVLVLFSKKIIEWQKSKKQSNNIVI